MNRLPDAMSDHDVIHELAVARTELSNALAAKEQAERERDMQQKPCKQCPPELYDHCRVNRIACDSHIRAWLGMEDTENIDAHPTEEEP